MALMLHEFGHRWSAVRFAETAPGRLAESVGDGANRGGSRVRLDITDGRGHWSFFLAADSPFPLTGEREGSVMSGGPTWIDNGDGTFTRIGPNWHTPVGYNAIDLYLMGMLPPEEVPPFFFIDDAERAGEDADGNEIWRGDRIDLTIDDVIAANGPRTPGFAGSQKEFSLLLVGVVLEGRKPSRTIRKALKGYHKAFGKLFAEATDGVGEID